MKIFFSFLRNGGGVFFIPYFIFLFIVGIPLFTLELSLGQYTSQGAMSAFKMAPIFRGLGLSMNIASFYVALYYNMIIGYALYYLVLSFRKTLLWSKCNRDTWATDQCVDDYTSPDYFFQCNNTGMVKWFTGRCYNSTEIVNNQLVINATSLGCKFIL
jgi:SNF family Na+-dependent transporter